MQQLKQLFLHQLHQDAGAVFGAFAGYNMPISYPLGVLKEHLYTRQYAGLFDISHMQVIEISGFDARDFAQYCLPIDAQQMPQGKSQYSFLLNDQAGIIDDLIVTKLAEDRYYLVVNAANAAKDYDYLQKNSVNFAKLQIIKKDFVLLALQGPSSAKILSDIAFVEPLTLNFMSAYETEKGWFISRSGYTGEDGFELALPQQEAFGFVHDLLNHPELKWIGLAARDSLRLEAGLCLHGTDIDERISPVEAGLLWAIDKNLRQEGNFIGAEKLRQLIAHKPDKIRAGFKAITRQPVRGGAVLYDENANEIGYISSGSFSPCLNIPIAMGYIMRTAKENAKAVFAKQRGKLLEMQIVKMPFVAHNYIKGNI